MGILTIENMLTESGNFLGFNELKQKETTSKVANYVLWLGIVHSPPCEWRRMIKAGNITNISQPTLPRNFHSDQDHNEPDVLSNQKTDLGSRGDCGLKVRDLHGIPSGSQHSSAIISLSVIVYVPHRASSLAEMCHNPKA